MPVKNTKRRTNDGLEGVITGLTEEEKNILNSAISGGALLVDTVNEMNALLEEKDLKDGQLCYCKETTTLYVLENNTWVEVGGGGGIPVVEGTESTTTTDGAYTTYTIPEAQTSCFIFKCDLGTAFISYNDIFETYNGYLDAEGDVIDGSLKLNDLIVLSGSGTKIDIFFGNIGGSGLPIVQATLSGTIGEIKTYTIPEKQTSPFILSIDGNYVLTSVSASGNDYYGEYHSDYKYYYISGGDTSILLRENTSFIIGSKVIPLFTDYNILVPKDSSVANILPLPDDASTSTYVLKAVNGTVQWVKES